GISKEPDERSESGIGRTPWGTEMNERYNNKSDNFFSGRDTSLLHQIAGVMGQRMINPDRYLNPNPCLIFLD
ncbi:MAG: hypothetical protein PF904_08645, partial [Kiritimatiellae bacterium]|nr:hypothetical protein [Kiritimatiellia bacterium]